MAKAKQGPRLGGRILLGLALGLCALAGLPGPASAQYYLCNETSYVVQAAIGQPAEKTVQTAGWYTIYPGYCQTAIEQALADDAYYVHARTIAGNNAPIQHWSGEHRFCVNTSAKFNLNGDADCEREGMQSAYFARVLPNGKKDWTTTFTEPGNLDPDSAKVLGVQRLLMQLGFLTDRQIDGYWGRGTERAIERFARQNSVKVPSEPNAELFDALVRAVQKETKAQGLQLCNNAADTIWAAYGLPNTRGAPITKGWFEIQPAQCVQATRDSLDKLPSVYLYAETVDAAAEKIYWKGATHLCTNDVMFALAIPVETCEEQGYFVADFQEVATGGGGFFTYTFEAAGQAPKSGL